LRVRINSQKNLAKPGLFRKQNSGSRIREAEKTRAEAIIKPLRLYAIILLAQLLGPCLLSFLTDSLSGNLPLIKGLAHLERQMQLPSAMALPQASTKEKAERSKNAATMVPVQDRDATDLSKSKAKRSAKETSAKETSNAIRLKASTIKDAFKLADSAETQGQEQEAISLYKDLLERFSKTDPTNPKLPRAEARIARLHLLNNEYDKANTYYDRLLKHHQRLDEDPELMVDLDDLSNVYQKFTSSKEHHLDCLMRSLSIRNFINPKHPHLPESYRLIANYLLGQGDSKQALAWLDKAIAVDRTYPRQKKSKLVEDLQLRGNIFLQTNKVQEAESAFSESLKIAVDNACSDMLVGQSYLYLGLAQMKGAKHKEASENFNLAKGRLRQTSGERTKMLSGYLEASIKENESLLKEQTRKAGRGKQKNR